MAKYDQHDEYLALLFLNSQPNENGIFPAEFFFNSQLCLNLPSVKPLLLQNSFVTETLRSLKTTHSLPNISHRKILLGLLLMNKIFGAKRALP